MTFWVRRQTGLAPVDGLPAYPAVNAGNDRLNREPLAWSLVTDLKVNKPDGFGRFLESSPRHGREVLRPCWAVAAVAG